MNPENKPPRNINIDTSLISLVIPSSSISSNLFTAPLSTNQTLNKKKPIKSKKLKKPHLSSTIPRITPLLPNQINSIENAIKLASKSNYQNVLCGETTSIGLNPDLISGIEVRKTNHKNAEQKRRDSLKQGFENLKNVIPFFSFDKNPSKIMIITRSYEYICELLETKKKLDKEIQCMHRKEMNYLKKLKSKGFDVDSFSKDIEEELKRIEKNEKEDKEKDNNNEEITKKQKNDEKDKENEYNDEIKKEEKNEEKEKKSYQKILINEKDSSHQATSITSQTTTKDNDETRKNENNSQFNTNIDQNLNTNFNNSNEGSVIINNSDNNNNIESLNNLNTIGSNENNTYPLKNGKRSSSTKENEDEENSNYINENHSSKKIKL
jgi:hypothetical protein